MAHRRRPLARAFLLNTLVLVVELVGGVQASSLSLIVDGVIAGIILVTTIRSVAGSHEELLWPENVACGHE